MHTPQHLPLPLAKAQASLRVAGVAALYPGAPGSHSKASAALHGGHACQFTHISTSTLHSFRRSKLQGSGTDSVDTFKGQTPVQGGRSSLRQGSAHFVGKAPTRLRSETYSLWEKWEVVLALWNLFHLTSQVRMPRLRAVILPRQRPNPGIPTPSLVSHQHEDIC